MGSVTILPPDRSMLLMVTFMAKMWNMGRTQRVVSWSSMNSIRGWFSWERGRGLMEPGGQEITCAMLATRFPWVSITPLGAPVVPEL